MTNVLFVHIAYDIIYRPNGRENLNFSKPAERRFDGTYRRGGPTVRKTLIRWNADTRTTSNDHNIIIISRESSRAGDRGPG